MEQLREGACCRPTSHPTRNNAWETLSSEITVLNLSLFCETSQRSLTTCRLVQKRGKTPEMALCLKGGSNYERGLLLNVGLGAVLGLDAPLFPPLPPPASPASLSHTGEGYFPTGHMGPALRHAARRCVV